jgi:hypothetical protein
MAGVISKAIGGVCICEFDDISPFHTLKINSEIFTSVSKITNYKISDVARFCE